MVFKAIVHDAEEGGYWAEVPALPGCFTEGETRDELLANLKEAVTGCMAVDAPDDQGSMLLVFCPCFDK